MVRRKYRASERLGEKVDRKYIVRERLEDKVRRKYTVMERRLEENINRKNLMPKL